MTDKEIVNKCIEIAKKNGFRYMESFIGIPVEAIIFSHSFAKAFWGEEFISAPIFDSDGDQINDIGDVAWKVNLQQMVLEPEPLKYLEKFL